MVGGRLLYICFLGSVKSCKDIFYCKEVLFVSRCFLKIYFSLIFLVIHGLKLQQFENTNTNPPNLTQSFSCINFSFCITVTANQLTALSNDGALTTLGHFTSYTTGDQIIIQSFS